MQINKAPLPHTPVHTPALEKMRMEYEAKQKYSGVQASGTPTFERAKAAVPKFRTQKELNAEIADLRARAAAVMAATTPAATARPATARPATMQAAVSPAITAESVAAEIIRQQSVKPLTGLAKVTAIFKADSAAKAASEKTISRKIDASLSGLDRVAAAFEAQSKSK